MASIERSDRCARNVPRIDGSSTSTPGDVAAADMESDNALGHDMGVPSRLELRSPSGGTGTGEHWSFGGADDRLLRDCLDELAEFVTDAPLEEWDNRVRRHVVVAEDRWRAAMLLWPDEPFERGQQSFNPKVPSHLDEGSGPPARDQFVLLLDARGTTLSAQAPAASPVPWACCLDLTRRRPPMRGEGSATGGEPTLLQAAGYKASPAFAVLLVARPERPA
jgi:hypothetical protein